MDDSPRRFSVALAFPKNRRSFVEEVAYHLAEELGRHRVFYDRYHEAELARPDLDTYLTRLYGVESELLVIFLSGDYESETWSALTWPLLSELATYRPADTALPVTFEPLAASEPLGPAIVITAQSPESVAALILNQLQRLRADPDDPEGPQALLHRASPNTLDALARAEAFRSSTGQTRIHMEHLLIGLFDAQQSVAASRLRNAGLPRREHLRRILGGNPDIKVPARQPYRPAPLDGTPRLSKHVHQAVAAALELAGPKGTVYSELLLDGLLSVESCSVVQALPPEILQELRRHTPPRPLHADHARAVLTVVPDGQGGSAHDSDLLYEQHQLEPDVLAAVRLAETVSGTMLVDARAALHAALSIGGDAHGKSDLDPFPRFYKLVAPDPPVRTTKGLPRVAGRLEFPLSASFANSLLHSQWPPSGSSHIATSDWIAAALLAHGDPSLQDFAQEFGHSVAALQDLWFSYVTEEEHRRPPQEWASWWRAAGVPLPPERAFRPGYHPEAIKAQDRLGIEPEVLAFARLIADDATTPPLSIGLLGDWGSGKSFFMELLHDKVAELTAPAGDSPTASNFAQVRFNAWHYSDANLWASLVGHIFDEIWTTVVPQDTPAESRRELEQELEDAHGALFEAEAQVDEARDLLHEAEAQIEREREMLAINRVVREATSDHLAKLAKEIGWIEPLEAVVQIEDALRQLSGSERRLRETLHLALQQYPARTTLGWIAGIVLGATAIAVLAARIDSELIRDSVARVAALGGVVASLVSAVAVPLSHASKRVRDFTGALRTTVEEYADSLEELRKDPLRRAEAARIDEAREGLARAQDRAAAARERILDLETRRASLDPGRRLAAFLESRVQSEDYRSRQGILSLVRRDFERLTQLMADWAEPTTAPPGIRPLKRIVLYIDDLDRCRPSVVVQALEAVHLLLALKLFVVVVAVDSRWLLRSLEVHYSELLRARREVGDGYRLSTPHSYLEKIFQVTFALAPMDPEGFGRYVEFLAHPLESAEPDRPERLVESPHPAPTRADADDRKPDSSPPGPPAHHRSARDPEAADSRPENAHTPPRPQDEPAAQAAELAAVPPRIDPSVPLVITEAERTLLKSLHPLVPTPRLAKRLVNVFRLIKGGVPTARLREFEHPQVGRHRAILLLLGILYGRPGVAFDLFRHLCDGAAENWEDDAPLHDAIRRSAARAPAEKSPESAGPRSSLAQVVERVAPEVTVGECRLEAPEVARYSLLTGQHAHTWLRTQPDPPP